VKRCAGAPSHEASPLARQDAALSLAAFPRSLSASLSLSLPAAAGLEDVVENDGELGLSGRDARKLFNAWVAPVPHAGGTRSLRPEEALASGLARLAPLIDKANPPPAPP